MRTYHLNITINEGDRQLQKTLSLEAENANELSQKLNALKVLNQSVKHEDLISTVEMIHEKPDLIPVVKDMIEEGESLSEAQLLLRLPKYVRQVLKVLKS
ncbi:MAG: hypothetical protein A2W91_05565 [Bacteroidetes bacterium GWF2_38_335]|nr:MAG: hypothetical protein A2W91_05565 [Bacteroidetes bacterium GWF2_38_335]HBS88088.1 hypothetical protein [Bacteroidales bacterium]